MAKGTTYPVRQPVHLRNRHDLYAFVQLSHWLSDLLNVKPKKRMEPIGLKRRVALPRPEVN